MPLLPTTGYQPIEQASEHSAAPPEGVQLIVAVIEGMAGRRALHQVGQWLSDVAFGVVTKAQLSGRWRAGRIGSIRTQMPRPGAVEAAVRVLVEGRSTACAIRLDQRGKRWVCTDVRIAA